MGSIDGLREQVEELKQRLNAPATAHGSEPGELKTRLATIKASLETKQNEITQLTADKERFAAEKQQLSAENDQLRRLLSEVLAVIDGQSADASTRILREFLAETDPLIKPTGGGPKHSGAAGQPANQAIAAPGRAGMVAAGAREQGEGPAGAAAAMADAPTSPRQGPEAESGGAEEEESPALRRIMKRGHRAG